MMAERALPAVSLGVIRAGQSPSGAYVAAPSFPTYQYSWFRDGAFIAYAMQLSGDPDSARRFHEWAISVIRQEADQAEAAIARSRGGLPPSDGAHLRARYPAYGTVDHDTWPNFQLDGYGIWLWSLHAYVAAGHKPLPGMADAVDLVGRYLGQLWRTPCFDCWEEHGDEVHVSTLCAIYGGLASAAALTESAKLAVQAAAVREFVLEYGTVDGRLRKHLGTELLDASLLWAATPFRLLEPSDPVMRRTADQLQALLTGPGGGIRRYVGDTYYGGGEWILLTAHLGWYWVEAGAPERAREALQWVERAADPNGYLAEQLVDWAQFPSRIVEWTARWGAVASPLLWSHAAYLILRHSLQNL
jgi:GH15 family glucan-1,4-alpha-glucosidase